MMASSAIRSLVATAVIVLLGLMTFAALTSGFKAVTSDGVRRVQLQQEPRALPDLTLVDERGQTLSLANYSAPSPQVTFVTLIYVQCQSICRTSVAGQSWLQHAIQVKGLQDKVRLLTLSFDPINDTPEIMASHARRMNADAGIWRFATVRNPVDLPTLLKTFDIIVLPDGLGDYSHNAALFLVNEDGRLSRAYDIDRPDLALADYLAQSRQNS